MDYVADKCDLPRETAKPVFKRHKKNPQSCYFTRYGQKRAQIIQKMGEVAPLAGPQHKSVARDLNVFYINI